MRRLQILLLFCVAALWAMPVTANRAPPDPEIEALIARVAQSRDMTFIRNGKDYSPAQAASHLRRKLQAAHGRIHTAEDFIAHIGTRSSLSGEPYRVRLADGRQSQSAPWLYGLLRDIRRQRKLPATAPSR